MRHTLSAQQRLAILGIIVFGFALAYAGFHFLKDRKAQREFFNFKVTASNSALAIKRTIDTTHNALKSISSLYDSSDYVDRQQFQRFVSKILKDRSELLALEWVPRVTHAKIDDFINAARYDGYSRFEIREQNQHGKFVAVEKREIYYPVFFVEPIKQNKSLLGFDKASNIATLHDMEKARDSVQWVASNLPHASHSHGDKRVIHMIDPVYQFDMTDSTITDRRFYHKGFAIGVLDINLLIRNALAGMQLNEDVSVFLYDKSSEWTKAPIGYFGIQGNDTETHYDQIRLNHLSFDMKIGQRDWTAVVVNRKPFVTGIIPFVALATLIAITLLCAYFIYYQFTQHENIKQIVKERTAELKEHKEHLEDMVRNRTEIIAQQAEELKLQLEREQELNEMQRSLVTMASHEFRTPLAIIDSSAHRLKRRIKKGAIDTMDPLIGKINKAVVRMTTLMESTLASARMEKGKPQISPIQCEIKQLLQDCTDRQQELTQYHTISSNIDDLPDTIIADPVSLDQIFTNLLSNAVKYSPNSPRVSLVGWIEDDMAVISVSDSGIGIDEEDLPQMFNRFFRAKTAAGIAGTGIGLNIVKMLIEEHEGHIELTSEAGAGTTFSVYLPIQGPQIQEEDEAASEMPLDEVYIP